MAIPTSNPPPLTFPRTVAVTSFVGFNSSASSPTYEPTGISTAVPFSLCDPPGDRRRIYVCHPNTELVPLRPSEKSFFGTLGRAKTLPCCSIALGSKPHPSAWALKAKAIVLTPNLSPRITTARSTGGGMITILPAHTSNGTPSPICSDPVTMASLAVILPHPYVTLFLQTPVILASLGMLLLSCGLLRKFRAHHMLLPILFWPWYQIRRLLKAGLVRGVINDKTVGPSAGVPGFLGAERHEDRLNSYLGSNFSVVAGPREDENGLFQVDSRESGDGDTTALVPSLKLKPGSEDRRNGIGGSNSAQNVRSRPSGTGSISRSNAKGFSDAV